MNGTAKIERDYLLIPGATYPKLPSGTLCSAFDCNKVVAARGLCNTHYRRWHRNGTASAMKRPEDWGSREKHSMYRYWCQFRRNWGGATGEWGKDFWLFVKEVGERPSPDHMLVRKECHEPYGPLNAVWVTNKSEFRGQSKIGADYQRMRRANDPTYEHKKKLQRHGVTLEEYESLLERQNGVCAICERPEPRVHQQSGVPQRLSLDHCHDTHAVRGLLCSYCNSAIGQMDDEPALLERAISYLRNPPAKDMGITHSGRHAPKIYSRSPSPHVTKPTQ